MQSDLPKTVNEALKILAYNEFFWVDPGVKGQINPHPKDRSTVISLAESQYAWTEKQAKLGLMLMKRYLTKFKAHGMDIQYLADNPVYDDDFRVISHQKTIRVIGSGDEKIIEVRFPYQKKLIQLIRCLKDKRNAPGGYFSYDGDSKKWLVSYTDLTVYYLTLIGARYDFQFSDEDLLRDYDEIAKIKRQHKKVSADLEDGKVVLRHAPESMQDYWKTVESLPLLQQVDLLKNLQVPVTFKVQCHNEVASRIAHHKYHKLWIDSKCYSKETVVKALIELDAFPIIMPCHSDVQEAREVEEFWEWLNIFKKNGIDILKQCSWGFDLREPVYEKDNRSGEQRKIVLGNQTSQQYFQNSYELYQMSKQFKYIDSNTKVLFVRNRIPRAMIKSHFKPKCSLIALGGGYYATGTENLKRFLENLPKKLYYSDHQPSSWDWHDHVIVRI